MQIACPAVCNGRGVMKVTQVQLFASMAADTAEAGARLAPGKFYLPEWRVGREHYTRFNAESYGELTRHRREA